MRNIQEVKSKIIKRINEIVKDKRIKQKELCELLGWKQPQVSKLLNYNKESNKKTTTLDSMFYVCEKLQIEINVNIKESKIQIGRTLI